jgi:hypothetical protein
MADIIPFTEFNPSLVQLSKLKTLDNGGKTVYVSYNGAPLVLQTPEMVAPYGMSKWDNDGKGPAKYTLDLSFKGMDTRDHLKTFNNALQDFDSLLVNGGLSNSDEWFKKKITSKDVVEALYTCVLRRSKDDKYPPTFKMTVPCDPSTGDFRCKVFDKNTKDPLDLTKVNLKGARVTAIVQCTGIWIAGGKFGSTWKIVQLRVEQTAKITEYAFKEIAGDKVDDIDSSDDDDDAGDIIKDAPVINNKDDDSDIIESSDDEIDSKSKVVKKTASKKK